MENQILELEKRITYLEKYVDDLNEVVVSQQKQLDAHSELIIQFKERFRGIDQWGQLTAEEEKPPHY